MRNLHLTFVILSGILFLKTEINFAQNLEFNQAVFYTYGPGNADGNMLTPMFSETLVVGSNQVLKITSTNCSSINATMFGGQVITVGVLAINDFHFSSSSEVPGQLEWWLPAGTYTIKGFEFSNSQTGGSFKGMISGILYDIVP
jgi:hypothetical protein